MTQAGGNLPSRLVAKLMTFLASVLHAVDPLPLILHGRLRAGSGESHSREETGAVTTNNWKGSTLPLPSGWAQSSPSNSLQRPESLKPAPNPAVRSRVPTVCNHLLAGPVLGSAPYRPSPQSSRSSRQAGSSCNHPDSGFRGYSCSSPCLKCHPHRFPWP